eukprot:CAMPEP_0114398480 /NCGR_PEP_ID=MMETSP0102-20121206/14933_1 /TAXON_ID=38822 ORGANISM="Pteridomonas danica, Strain PT" /NCGR_SAMPLE_ID=MMETSP0102 /ASSEMBLY_ACC=CAM_ASM_000212 /LENGTH=48 /DNA_ID= /DNA_START= /DNA_END= /DNA_ORIENTATION=
MTHYYMSQWGSVMELGLEMVLLAMVSEQEKGGETDETREKEKGVVLVV